MTLWGVLVQRCTYIYILVYSGLNVVVIYTCLVVIALLAHRGILDRSAYMDPSGHYPFWCPAASQQHINARSGYKTSNDSIHHSLSLQAPFLVPAVHMVLSLYFLRLLKWLLSPTESQCGLAQNQESAGDR